MNRNKIAGILGLALATIASASNHSPAFAVDNMETTATVDLSSVRAKIAAKDYASALVQLRELAENNQQADVYNLLGFTLRKTGDFDTSLTYYQKALDLQPDHKAAHEYLGELYVDTGKMDKAGEQLASLAALCPGGCEELSDLQQYMTDKGVN
ncbi:Flp pilus assembly protein TadD [Phyllobacterium sp. 1468]|uniref:tetratricopeptide repeat protein n=1 Tax=Phyllobacterium sp. 1468 TaxID=2817759 RepID=UPI00285F752D|nr:tetratricopeptide repeat protein [Phyllobacterium sp. 1468]MDR6635810.1 Flp pilus assembly protein TadD [Phyllobacterium sp. 1468]